MAIETGADTTNTGAVKPFSRLNLSGYERTKSQPAKVIKRLISRMAFLKWVLQALPFVCDKRVMSWSNAERKTGSEKRSSAAERSGMGVLIKLSRSKKECLMTSYIMSDVISVQTPQLNNICRGVSACRFSCMAVEIFLDLATKKFQLAKEDSRQVATRWRLDLSMPSAKCRTLQRVSSVAWIRFTPSGWLLESFGILATQKFQLAKVDQQIQVSRSRARVRLAAQQLSTWSSGSVSPGQWSAHRLVSVCRVKCLAGNQADKKNPGTGERVGVVGGWCLRVNVSAWTAAPGETSAGSAGLV